MFVSTNAATSIEILAGPSAGRRPNAPFLFELTLALLLDRLVKEL
jgi:hypothetical protein